MASFNIRIALRSSCWQTAVGWTGDGQVPDEHAMSFAAAWRPDGLYLFIQILDPDRNPAQDEDEAWMGDGVEIYVDADGVYPDAGGFDDPGARRFVIAAPAGGPTPTTRAEAYLAETALGSWSTTQLVVVRTTDGYNIEVFVTADDLGLDDWPLAEDGTVGFDLAHNVSVPPGEAGSDGNRDGQYFLRIAASSRRGPDDYPYRNENAFCTTTLLAE